MTDNPSEASDKACYRTSDDAVRPASEHVFLLNAWLHGRPATTARCYRRDAECFLAHVSKPLRHVTLEDLQAWAAALSGAPASNARRTAAVCSLCAFATSLGYLPQDPSHLLRVRKPAASAPRIISETDVQRMFGAESDPRARVTLRLLYLTGARNSELCNLRHSDITVRRKGIDARIIGKGLKPRIVELPRGIWRDVTDLNPSAKPDDPVATRPDGRPFTERALHRLVRRAAARIGLTAVSPHWLRHAHASHALDRGAPVHLVKENMGHASLVTTSGYLHPRPGDSSSNYLPDTGR